jgi:TPR repeat protein
MRKLISSLVLAAAVAVPGVAAAGNEFDEAQVAHERGEYGRAVQLYQVAAEAGDARAEVTLGYMFWYGQERYGVAVQGDVGTAVDWFARAADHGNAVGSVMLSLMFQDGERAEPAVSTALWQGH